MITTIIKADSDFERIGDDRTNIAQDVIFVRLRRIVRHLHAVL
jgi:hypothetical protein